ncbi:MAG: hypothetical protein LBG71_02435 [Clostridiales Family XIII bacterium]|jgi:hypothetical protein|nr:hypothetical protein [Clostridiales Family XIII bacterium]
MRRTQQKQLLGFLETLEDARLEMRRAYGEGRVEPVLGTLGDCEVFAESIGRFVSDAENGSGKGAATLALIDGYRGELARARREIAAGAEGGAALIKGLRKHLADIGNSVRADLAPDRIEALFLPYKASMWDSMHSVWEAADADPFCDAYVAPIPYYEVMAGGCLGPMRYEGASYPSGVPVIDWRGYDLEARRPDVIYIHNPYDDANLVTSVHPDFFSGRIKDFTDMLCYLPYWVSANAAWAEPLLALQPGAFNSHRTFWQSERLRDFFIGEYKKWERDNNSAGAFGKPEEKFVALGSAKLDMAINSRPEDFTLPEEWRGLIYRADGTKKKVVLLNSSLWALLHGNEKYVEKLRGAFRAFEGRDDAVLWWRPHPLSASTYNALRPHLAKAYSALVDEYARGGAGIYDGTAEPHRAICLSDAYYGDGGSLMALYAATGKPIMMEILDVQTPAETAGPPEGESRQEPSPREAAIKAAMKDPAACVRYEDALFIESAGFGLRDYIEMLMDEGNSEYLARRGARQRELFLGDIAHGDGTAGAAIYEHCKEFLGFG